MNASGLMPEVRAYYTQPAGGTRGHAARRGLELHRGPGPALRPAAGRLPRRPRGQPGRLRLRLRGDARPRPPRGFAGAFRGYDIALAMVEAGRSRHGGDPPLRFSADEAFLAGTDYVLASGILNVKLGLPSVRCGKPYVEETLARLASLARKGFAFNALTATRTRTDAARPALCRPVPAVRPVQAGDTRGTWRCCTTTACGSSRILVRRA